MMANHPAFGKYDISSLRIVGIGGAALPTAVSEKYMSMGISLIEGYGMSETTATTVMNPGCQCIRQHWTAVPANGYENR
jgi:long-subunit acyl-CoA synthetase (AMP-forming)